MVVVLALLAATANALASVCERLGVEDAPPSRGPSMSLVRHMVRRPVWVLGFVVMAGGYAAQAVALHLGSLNVVQPLMVSELVILVVVLWLWYATPMRARDGVSAFLTAIGLGTFLFVAAPTVGHKVASDGRWSVVGLAGAGVVGLLVALGSRGSARRRALLRGAGASVGFALLAALTVSVTDALVAGPGALFASWQLYALGAVGLFSFVVMQSAFQVGPFAASQSALILVNPFVSIVVGRALFGEALRAGPLDVTVEVLALVVMVGGAVGLTTSPLMANVHEQVDGGHRLTGRGRYARRSSKGSNVE
jgi:drug/metabolite transporter (DMT)-like permease